MKKDYMKPEGKIVAMNINENIATSTEPGNAGDNFGINYRIEGDKKYIYTSSYEASNTGNAAFDRFYDLIASYIYGIDSACRYDPD